MEGNTIINIDAVSLSPSSPRPFPPPKKHLDLWQQFSLSVHSWEWTSPEGIYLPPRSSLPSMLLWAVYKKSPSVSTQPRLPFVFSGLEQWRVHPAAWTGLFLSWNITVLHSQIKVSSISLPCGVKSDLLTSWMQQPGVEMVMTASVRGSIQLGICFPPLWWKG